MIQPVLDQAPWNEIKPTIAQVQAVSGLMKGHMTATATIAITGDVCVATSEAMYWVGPCGAVTLVEETNETTKAVLISQPDAILIRRNDRSKARKTRTKTYTYKTMTNASRRRLWRLSDQMQEIAGSPHQYAWHG